MEVFLVYLWLKINAFSMILLIAGIILMLMIVWYKMKLDFAWDAEGKKIVRDQWWSVVKRNFFIGVACVIISTATPSAQQVAILVGTSYAVDFAKSPEGAKIGQLIRKKANDYLDEQLKEVQKPVEVVNPK